MKTATISVTGKVKPMPAPAFPVCRGSEQFINHFFKRIGGSIIQKFLDCHRTRGQACEVKIGPPHQGSFIGLRRGFEPLGFEAGKHESIQRLTNPVLLPNLWDCWARKLLQGPVIAASKFSLGNCRANSIHPSSQSLDFILQQLPFRRHVWHTTRLDHLDHQALG